MKELQDIESYLLEIDLESADVTLLVDGMLYSTWIDEYLDEKIMEIKNEVKLINDS
ncbi:MAG: hypothetical protein ACXADW_12065 [Candidatus Hodarchaeales archaeon]